MIKRRIVLAFCDCDLSQRHRFAAVPKHVAVPAVCGLFERCRPSTIAWFVIAVIVDSIYGVFRRWAWPHVRKECRKIIDPSIAYCNSTPSPNVKVSMSRIKATFFDTGPATVFGGFGLAMCGTGWEVLFPTAARFGLALQEIPLQHDALNAAITAAAPLPIRLITCAVGRSFSRNDPPIESRSNHAHMIPHNLFGLSR